MKLCQIGDVKSYRKWLIYHQNREKSQKCPTFLLEREERGRAEQRDDNTWVRGDMEFLFEC